MPRPPSMTRALATALRSAQLDDQDAAAVALAKAYAARIDSDPEALVKVGHLVLPVLTALGLTPAARKAVAPKGATASGTPSRLDELRARRASRASRASALDAPAP